MTTQWINFCLSLLAMVVALSSIVICWIEIRNLRDSVSSRMKHWEPSLFVNKHGVNSPEPEDVERPPQPPPTDPMPQPPENEIYTDGGQRVCPRCRRKAAFDETCAPPVAYCKCGWRDGGLY